MPKGVLENFPRKHAIALRYLETVRVYIALRVSPSRGLDCEWIGHVPDYYIFYFCGLGEAVLAFRSSDLFDTIDDSDVEDGAPLSPECENMFLLHVGHGLDVNTEEDEAEERIES